MYGKKMQQAFRKKIEQMMEQDKVQKEAAEKLNIQS